MRRTPAFSVEDIDDRYPTLTNCLTKMKKRSKLGMQMSIISVDGPEQPDSASSAEQDIIARRDDTRVTYETIHVVSDGHNGVCLNESKCM